MTGSLDLHAIILGVFTIAALRSDLLSFSSLFLLIELFTSVIARGQLPATLQMFRKAFRL